MRPPFAYYGGKVGMAPLIASVLPPHRVYMEPFFGSGAVLFAKRQTRFEIVNDADENIVTFFRVLRERPGPLAEVCALTPHARDEYRAADLEVEDLDDLERARRFWVCVNQSFSKTAGRRTGWSVTTARSQSMPDGIAGRIDRFMACAERLRHVSIENCDAADLVARLATGDTAIYVDPPYPGGTRVSRAAGGLGDYRVDMLGPDAHSRLAEVLRATPAAVVISGYPCDLYDEDLYPDWDTLDVNVHAHSSNAVTAERGHRVERLWSNRPIARNVQGDMFEEVS